MTKRARNVGIAVVATMIVGAVVAFVIMPSRPLPREMMSEVLAAVSACKTSVAEYASAKKKLPADTESSGCSNTPTLYMSSLDVSKGGVIKATIGAIADQSGRVLTMTPNKDMAGTPASDGDTILAWKCSYDGNTKYVPASCR